MEIILIFLVLCFLYHLSDEGCTYLEGRIVEKSREWHEIDE